MKSFTKKPISFLFFTVLFTSLISFVYAQNVLVVDNNQGAGAQYTSLQTAIDAASPGDLIYVQPSQDHYGTVTVTKQLGIFGLGHNPELNAGEYARVLNVTFEPGSSNSMISGLVLNQANVKTDNIIIMNNKFIYTGVNGNSPTIQANSCIVMGNIFENQNQKFNLENAQNWVISNNIIDHRSVSNGVQIFNQVNSSIIVKNNIIRSKQNADAGGNITLFLNANGVQIFNNIFLFTGANVTNFAGSNLNFQNNLTYSYNSTLNTLSGSNNMDNVDPLFVAFNRNSLMASLSNDFHFQTGSPAIGSGNDGNDLGIFTGFNFDMRGYPQALPYLTEFSLYNTTISPGSTLNINVKANANNN